MKNFIVLLAFVLLKPSVPKTVQAQENIFNRSGQPIPRFVSVKSDKVFVRSGPGVRYPIRWVFKKKGYPIEVIQEFDTWRKIKDHEGEEGWIHQTLLSGKRHALITEEKGVVALKKPLIDAQSVAFLEQNVVAKIEQCASDWCQVEASGFKGWIERKSLWGVYEGEQIN